MWPSVHMAERVAHRLANAGRAETVSHVNYQDAGHTLLGVTPPAYPAENDSPAIPTFDFGGTPEANRCRCRRLAAYRKLSARFPERLAASESRASRIVTNSPETVDGSGG
jgi:BAAT / Acyl-CoA thioester hydrolase C terminal